MWTQVPEDWKTRVSRVKCTQDHTSSLWKDSTRATKVTLVTLHLHHPWRPSYGAVLIKCPGENGNAEVAMTS
jgi:hypothetical protein